jgi:zinc transport system substrate-binding protein
MNKKVRLVTCLTILMVLAGILAGCQNDEQNKEKEVLSSDNGKIQIVATLFPQYDFAREIAGDKADVTLLLPPGVESHSFEPTPSDMIKIKDADLFIYTGEYMEAWAQDLLKGTAGPDSHVTVLDVSKGIQLDTISDAEARLKASGHEHEETTDNDHLFDPHIWTSPVLAKKMVENIRDSLCRLDPDHEDYYKANAQQYLAELDALDKEFRAIVENGVRKEIIFGDRFALYYFAKEYGLTYEAAFDSCSKETEPSAKTIAHLIEEIKEKHIPVIYYGELTDPKAARSISEETGAKMLMLHSCHNLAKSEFERGETYLTLMKQNAENLKEGLN